MLWLIVSLGITTKFRVTSTTLLLFTVSSKLLALSITILLLLVIIWFPHFMLGSAEERIQSVRAREVAGETVIKKPIVQQGRCPICNIETTAKKYSSGKLCTLAASLGVSPLACVGCMYILQSNFI